MGTAGQVALGLTGLDFAADIRDIVYDFSHWEWSGKHIGQTILDIIGLVPGIGVVKNIDDAAGLVKNVIKNSDLAEKTAKNVLDKVDELMPALKRSMDSPSIAPLLGNIMKSSDEAAGVGKKVVKSGDEIKAGITDASKLNSYSMIPDSMSVGPGKKFTKTQKDKIIQVNINNNGGIVKSDLSGKELIKPQKNQIGIKPDPNEWQIDHINPRSKGGTNSFSNAQVLSREENRNKWYK